MRRSTVVTGLLCVASVTVGADRAAARPMTDTAAAFERLKTLVGEWEADTPEGRVHVSYELVAGGTALLEKETSPNMPAMVTVYHRDGGRLLLTHYCMAGNQPRMEARSYEAAAGELNFEFVDATNLAGPAAGHMHSMAMRVIDADHLLTEWKFFQDGRPKMTESVRLTRLR